MTSNVGAELINFVVPAFAQEKDTVDPQTRQQVETAAMKYDEAFNKNDAAAVAALFTQDAIEVGPDGPDYGQQCMISSPVTMTSRSSRCSRHPFKIRSSSFPDLD
jgi:Domain of unknown function (DUF4440)